MVRVTVLEFWKVTVESVNAAFAVTLYVSPTWMLLFSGAVRVNDTASERVSSALVLSILNVVPVKLLVPVKLVITMLLTLKDLGRVKVTLPALMRLFELSVKVTLVELPGATVRGSPLIAAVTCETAGAGVNEVTAVEAARAITVPVSWVTGMVPEMVFVTVFRVMLESSVHAAGGPAE